MNIIRLRSFLQVTSPISAVDHTAMHGNGLKEDSVDNIRPLGLFHGSNASLRDGQIDRLCEVQGNRGGVAEV